MNVKSSNLMTIAGVMLLLIGSTLAFAGGAAAVDYSTDYSSDDSVHVSETFDASDDTATVFADVETITTIADGDDTDTSTDVRFVVQGINESADPASTELDNVTRTVEQDTLESYTYETSDSENSEYESFYLHVESVVDAESDRINSTDAGTTVVAGGGGGIGLDGEIAGMSVPLVGGLVLVGYFVMRD